MSHIGPESQAKNRSFVEQQIADWEHFWQRFRRELMSSEPGKYPSMQTLIAPLGVPTLVTRLSGSLLETACELQTALRRVDGAHYFYPPTDLHMTVRGLGDFLPCIGEASDDQRQAIFTACRVAISAAVPFAVKAWSLNVFPTTIVVQLLIETPSLLNIRQTLEKDIATVIGPPCGKSAVPPPHLAYCNIVRFTRQPTSDAMRFVESHRTGLTGTMLVTDVELVATDKLLSSRNTKRLRSFTLGSDGNG